MARRAGGDEVEGIDEEFLFHLNRGSELLLRGEADPAKASLERALELRPKDPKVLGLLGQAYYKLSRFDDAARVWQRLVDDNPVEPGARVNLGLACLKAKRHPDAVKQLEIALDLNPDHKKAMGYLGLALLESGNLTRAREWFKKAGSDHMVARCDELVAGRASAAPAAAVAEQAHAADVAEAVAQAQAQAAPEPVRTPPPGAVPAYRSAAPGEALGAWAASRVVHPGAADTFSLAGNTLLVAVRGEVRTRLDGLFATQGKVAMAGEMKRFRGRATEKPFGEGAERMHRVTGDGVLLFRTAGRRFTALDLGPDAAYLREEPLFGFEGGIAFENGRVPSSISAELHLVHLRGRGRFLLATEGEPVTLDVVADAPLKVPLASLVGWVGTLTPRVCALVEDGGAPVVVAVELTGEGRVIADPSAVEG
ncbi:MAG TPA: tetratricopeptide repeat protein [Anaeromyxobacter sp.]|nr:tetratricopeptide repeat protein [Anaeromyxobacter sp.]